VSAKPIAATLEKLFVGQRSGVSPVRASVRSQNQLNVRCSSVSRNAISRAVIVAVPGGNVGTLVGATTRVLHAEAATATTSRNIVFLTNGSIIGGDKEKNRCRRPENNQRWPQSFVASADSC
jgi:hypothetical protein